METQPKLVRDKIPEIIKESGQEPVVRELDEAEYVIRLHQKLTEEIAEFQQATTREEKLEELSDILEVIFALGKSEGASEETLLLLKNVKKDKRGGFNRRILLEQVKKLD